MGYMNLPRLEPQEIDEENNASDSETLKEKNEKALKNVLEKTSEDDWENGPQYIEPISFLEKN